MVLFSTKLIHFNMIFYCRARVPISKMLTVQLPLLHTVLIIETTEALTGKTAGWHAQGITMNNYQSYTSLYPYFPYHLYSPFYQLPPPSRCLPGCGGPILLITCVSLPVLALAVTVTKLNKLRTEKAHTDPLHCYNQTGGGEGETKDRIYDEVGEGTDPVGEQKGHYQELKLETMDKKQYETCIEGTRQKLKDSLALTM